VRVRAIQWPTEGAVLSLFDQQKHQFRSKTIKVYHDVMIHTKIHVLIYCMMSFISSIVLWQQHEWKSVPGQHNICTLVHAESDFTW
jgi:hypothetical protein